MKNSTMGNTLKTPLIGKSLKELENVVTEMGMPRFVGSQLAKWLYDKKVDSFERMTNISGKNRARLEEFYVVGREKPVAASVSTDGTVKYLFDVGSGRKIESVYIPDKERATLCVSSQVGCKMNCYFCATGKAGYKANLTAAQIINQILSIPPEGSNAHELTNVVFMGMGEPLDNYSQLVKVIEILTAPWGFGWSPKRITVSTVGKLPELKDLLEQTQVHVALSVHTADARQRLSMMPAEKAFPVASVMKLLSGYDFSHQRRLSLEYIMWRNINDDLHHADLLAKLIGNVPCRVNLIRYHVIDGIDLVPSAEDKMINFRNYLNSKGIISTIRTSRGEDIKAACGMLATTGGAAPLNQNSKK
jgi:23S rRNA (adenine2503-C2)-methyltransferase